MDGSEADDDMLDDLSQDEVEFVRSKEAEYVLSEEEIEFAQLNERARMLGERALYYNDADATKELQLQFSPLIVRMVNSVSKQHQSELRSVLAEATLRALKRAIDKRVDRPLAYTLRAIRNAYIRYGIRLRRRLKHEGSLPDGYDVADPQARERYDHRTAVLRKIHEYRERARNSRSKLDAVLAEVIAVCYLNEISPSEAYNLLGLSPNERTSLGERLSRERRNPQSLLNQLGDEIRRVVGGLFDDETLARGGDRPDANSNSTGHLTEDGTES